MNLRRIMFILGIIATVSCVAVSFLHPYTALIFSAAAFTASAVSYIVGRKWVTLYRCFLPLIFCAVFILITALNYIYKVEPAKMLAGNSATITGKVCEDPEYDNGIMRIKIRTESISLKGSAQNVKILLILPVEDAFSYGDRVRADITFSSVTQSEEKKYYPDGIYVKANGSNITPLKSGKINKFYSTAIKIRNIVKARILTYYDSDVSGFLCGLAIGDSSGMSQEVYDAFIAGGIIHLTAVSGLHLGVIAGLIYSILKRFSRTLAGVVTIASVFMIMGITAFTPSIVRAGTMYIIMTLAATFSRRSDPLNSLGLAMAVMVTTNPYIWMNASFVLTITSVIGIVTLTRPVTRTISYPLRRCYSRLLLRFKNKPKHLTALEYLKRFAKYIVGIASLTIAASAFVTPAVALIFGRVSLLTVPANLFAVAAGSFDLILLVISLIIPHGILLVYLREFLVIVVSLIARYVISIAVIFGSGKYSSIQLDGSTAISLAVTVAASVGVIMIFAAFGKKSIITTVMAVVLPIAIVAVSSLFIFKGYSVTMLQVSGYSCIISKGDTAVVIGSGNRYSDALAISETLNNRGINKLKAVIVPNSDNCKGGADYLAAKYNSPIYCNPKLYKKFKSDKLLDINALSIHLGDDAVLYLADTQSETVGAKIKNAKFLFITRKCENASFTKDNDIIFLSPGAASSPHIANGAFKVFNGDNLDENSLKKFKSDKNCYITNDEFTTRIEDKGEIALLKRKRLPAY